MNPPEYSSLGPTDSTSSSSPTKKYHQTSPSPDYRSSTPLQGEGLQTFYANAGEAPMEIRKAFIRKVYTLLTLQLLLTFTFSLIFYNVPSVKQWVYANFWAYITSVVLSLVAMIAMFVLRKRHPWNLVLLSVFTVCMAYSIGLTTSMYSALVVVEAFALTLSIFVSLTLYVTYSKRDFSGLGPFVFTGIMVLVSAMFMQMILVLVFGVYSSAVDVAMSIFGSFLFSVFIVYDTFVIMNRLPPDEFIMATVDLYLDFLNLFLNILRLLNAAHNDR